MAPRATQKQSKLKQKTVKFGSLPTSTPARAIDPLTAVRKDLVIGQSQATKLCQYIVLGDT